VPPPPTPILRVRLCMEIKKKLAYLIILILSSPFFSASHGFSRAFRATFRLLLLPVFQWELRLSFFFQSLETLFFFVYSFSLIRTTVEAILSTIFHPFIHIGFLRLLVPLAVIFLALVGVGVGWPVVQV